MLDIKFFLYNSRNCLYVSSVLIIYFLIDCFLLWAASFSSFGGVALSPGFGRVRFDCFAETGEEEAEH